MLSTKGGTMESAWIVFLADDDEFVIEVFDNEKAAIDCFKYHISSAPSATYIVRIDPTNFQSTFTVPLEE